MASNDSKLNTTGEENATDSSDLENGGGESITSSSRTDPVVIKKRNNNGGGGDMSHSVFSFREINYSVGQGDKKKFILQDVNGTIKSGHVLALMGPSGAGKTTLINTLTLDAFYGNASGRVTLNGVRMNDQIFKSHCFVVQQQDRHWPTLTCRETLLYASQLYHVANDATTGSQMVDEILRKMGLQSCANTKCGSLSGGQSRRLSIAMALLKQPTVIFLDEPTSGLDAAAASNVMDEIVRVAKDERLIILCTIHQPSSRIYNSFDQVMLLSMGREAYAGNVTEASPYFESIGYPTPPAHNPAEFFLDLVNADFSDEGQVTRLLNEWEERKPETTASMHGVSHADQTSVTKLPPRGTWQEIGILFRRHGLMILRDPLLYVGRCVAFFLSNIFFGFVYWNARVNNQDQVQNKLWVTIWYIGVACNMGAVAVYALNEEFKSVLRESKNGMVSALSYVLAKSVLVIPIMFIFAIASLGIPAYVIQNYPGSSFGWAMLLYALTMYVFEAVAECFSVWFDDPILGMLMFTSYWFASFLFGGWFLPLENLYWPFKTFVYIMPFQHYVRSNVHNLFLHTDWEPCLDPSSSPVCVPSGDPIQVLDGLHEIYPLFTSENTLGKDLGILAAIAVVFKIFYVIGVIWKTRRVAVIQPNSSNAKAT